MIKIKLFFKTAILLNFLIIFGFSIFMHLQSKSVRAQESAPKADMIWQKERLDAAIVVARQDYSHSLEVYRGQDRLYNIAYDQNASLKTLASLEDLVIKTKTVTITRDDVLINYLELLKLSLYASEGVELSVKAYYLDLLEENLVALRKHREDLTTRNSKDELELSLEDFKQFEDLDRMSEQILALIALSRLQRIYDLAVPLKKDIDNFLTIDEENALSPLARASFETDKTLAQAEDTLDILWKKAERVNTLETIYRNLTRELNPVYINLSQSLTYLEELLEYNQNYE